MRRNNSKHYAEEDMYDEDDYDDYDDYDEPVPAKPTPKSAAPKAGVNAQPPSKGQSVPVPTAAQIAKQGTADARAGAQLSNFTSPGTAKAQLEVMTAAPSAEREVLAQFMPAVKAVVGTLFSDASIAAALRSANYDPDIAVEALLAEATALTPSPPQSPPAPNKTPVVPPPSKKGGSRLVIGASPTPAATATPPAAAAGGAASPAPQDAESRGRTASASLAASPTAASMHVNTYFPSTEDKVTTDVRDDDGKQAISLVMAGHVDTGKSTILGHLLVKLGHFSEREVHKLEQQAKCEGKASFHFAWILDQSEEERRRGVTIDSGVHSFETPNRRVSVLDAPGHKDYVAAMISSASQADVALFTVSASKGEFESGLNHMTKEHLSVLRTLGIPQIVVLVNKMDTVEYSQARFDEVVGKVSELAKSMAFRDGVIAGFCPISGFHAVNLLPNTPLPPPLADWYAAGGHGKSLIELVDQCQPAKRMLNYPFRMFISDITRQSLTGKIETGTLKVGDACVIVPSGQKVTVKAIERHLVGKCTSAQAGVAVEVTVSGDLQGVVVGDVLCPAKQRCPFGTTFEAHVQLFGNLKKALIPGGKLLLQMHALNMPVTVKRLLKRIDPATGKWSTAKMVKCIGADSQGLVEFELPTAVPLELAEDNRALGRFILRQEDETVGGGLIRGLPGLAPAAPRDP